MIQELYTQNLVTYSLLYIGATIWGVILLIFFKKPKDQKIIKVKVPKIVKIPEFILPKEIKITRRIS